MSSLRDPRAYPGRPDAVELVQTHVSLVFLAGERAYKVKKPVDLGFLDFRTVEAREAACAEEVRLNEALAPGVYRRVAWVTRESDGSLRVDGEGKPVEPVVEMLRLPRERMLDALLERGEVDNALVESLAALIARFHATAPTGPGIDEHGSPAAIAANVRENTEQTRAFAHAPGAHAGVRTLSPRLHRFLAERAEAFVAAERTLLERRVGEGHIREGHGDIHAGNVCVLPGGILVYDRIEFTPRFRCGDTVADIGFLAMDMDGRGFRGFAALLARRYAEHSGDRDLPGLLPFYKAYRAVVRGKVLSMAAADPVLDEAEREARRRAAMRSFALAATYDLPPCLVLTCGLPGSGKTTAARAIARPFEAVLLRSDVQRKRLAGLRPTEAAAAPYGEGIYRQALTDETYGALLDDAVSALRSGRSVVVDASFATAARRAPFVEAARELGLPVVVAHVEVPEAVARTRLEAREHDPGEVSDADLEVRRRMAEGFESPRETPLVAAVDGLAVGEEATAAVLDELVSGRIAP